MILRCTCIHDYQDEKYGKGNRVHNLSGNDSSKAYCTVCGTAHETRIYQKPEEKKENGN